MVMVQTIIGILLGLSALFFIVLAVFAEPLPDRQSETEPGISAANRLLRASLVKMKRAAAGDPASSKESAGLDKAA